MQTQSDNAHSDRAQSTVNCKHYRSRGPRRDPAGTRHQDGRRIFGRRGQGVIAAIDEGIATIVRLGAALGEGEEYVTEVKLNEDEDILE